VTGVTSQFNAKIAHHFNVLAHHGILAGYPLPLDGGLRVASTNLVHRFTRSYKNPVRRPPRVMVNHPLWGGIADRFFKVQTQPTITQSIIKI